MVVKILFILVLVAVGLLFARVMYWCGKMEREYKRQFESKENPGG